MKTALLRTEGYRRAFSTSRIYVSRRWIYHCNYVSEINVNKPSGNMLAMARNRYSSRYIETLSLNVSFLRVVIPRTNNLKVDCSRNLLKRLPVTELRWNANYRGLKDRGFLLPPMKFQPLLFCFNLHVNRAKWKPNNINEINNNTISSVICYSLIRSGITSFKPFSCKWIANVCVFLGNLRSQKFILVGCV